MKYTSPCSLKPHFLPVLALFCSYKAQFRPIGDESLTFGQTFKLRLEIRLINSNFTQKLYIPFMAIENLIFLPFWALFDSYKACFRLIRAESLIFDQTSYLRLKTSLISSSYTQKLRNTTFGTLKPYFSPFGPYSALIKPAANQG